MAVLTGQAARDYMAKNPNFKVLNPQASVWQEMNKPSQSWAQEKLGIGGFLGDVVSGVTSPFRQGLLDPAAQILSTIANPSAPIGSQDNFFTTASERKNYWEDPLTGGFKQGAGIAANAIPGGGAFGGGIRGTIGSGLATGAASGFASSQKGQELQDTLSGAGLGAGFNLAGLGIGKLANKAGQKIAGAGAGRSASELLGEFADERQLNALKRNVGTPAPMTGTKGDLKGFKLEQAAFEQSKKLGIPINSADDLLTISGRLSQENGTIANDMATQLTGKGVTTKVDDLIAPLQRELDNTASPTLKKPYQNVIDEIRMMTNGASEITPVQMLQLKREAGRLMSAASMDDKTLGEAWRTFFGNTNELLDNTFSKNGFKDFRQVNKNLETAIRLEDWANQAAQKARPTSTISHTSQQAAQLGSLGAGFAAGGPVGAALGFAGSKFAQSPQFENLLARGARGAANVLEGKSLPKLPGGANISPEVKNLMRNAAITGLVGSQNTGMPSGTPSLPLGANPMGAQMGTDPMGMGGGQANFGMSPSMGGQDPRALALGRAVLTGQIKPEQASIAMKLLGIGGEAKTPKLTENQIKAQTAAQNAASALQMLQDGGVQTGKLANIGTKITDFLGTTDARQVDFRAKLAGARSAAVSMLSGANVPADEYARLANMIPEDTDEPQVAAAKLNNFIQTMNMYSNQEVAQPMSPNMGYAGMI